MRVCPRDQTPLEPSTSGGIEVDICPSCRGIWLDSGEFDPLVAERFAGEPLETYFALSAEPAPPSRTMDCPVDGVAMYLVRFDDMELDWCPSCRGIWIDGFERDELSKTKSESVARHDSSSEVVPVGDEERPNLRELEFEGDGASLELDFAATEQPQVVLVHCASCGMESDRSRAMFRMDAYWCEVCVINGDFPGSHGPPVSRRMAEAALAMSKARVNLDARKSSVADMKKANEVVKRSFLTRRNDVHVARAVHATARAVANLFRKD